MNHPSRARITAVATAALLVALVSPPAAAHVEPSPAAVKAGAPATIEFTVEHGCGESPLVKLEIKVPDGVTGVSAVPAPVGWSGSVVDGVVTFTGGPQPAHQEIVFSLVGVMPAAPDTVLAFPTIETCLEGTVEWLAVPAEGGEEPEFPAPVVKLTRDTPTTAEETVPEDDHGEPEGQPAATPTTTSTTTVTTTTVAKGAASDATDEDDDSGSNGGVVVGILVALVIVGGAVAYVLVRRRGGASAGGTDSGSNP
ncbi:MAG: hypothetical protein JWM47_3761 [Acidimicrobiales bacterium]|nr:hypothetical protein [Acidimicrobiales bacterium]